MILQILFLILFLGLYEYGSADFIRRVTRRAKPNRLHYTVEAAPSNDNEKTSGAVQMSTPEEILKVSSISKYFGKEFAVENVSFNINANETLALLGGNGAGKTTTINMIRGDLVPNFGDIFLNGTSVLRHPAKARLQMGVCPQDDAVDNLSVIQTLRFYATVKGLKNVEGNVEKVLTAMNIGSYSDLLVRELSGGTKRKLSVAIALLGQCFIVKTKMVQVLMKSGNPRLLLLDEPSTGQDAGAKRILWKALKNVSANRAILLTTHSMEEASVSHVLRIPKNIQTDSRFVGTSNKCCNYGHQDARYRHTLISPTTIRRRLRSPRRSRNRYRLSHCRARSQEAIREQRQRLPRLPWTSHIHSSTHQVTSW